MTASLGSSTTPEIVYAGFCVVGAYSGTGDFCELATIGPNTNTQMKAFLTALAIRKRVNLQRTLPSPTRSNQPRHQLSGLALQSTACSANRSQRNRAR